jgi:DNA-directed RNA polymerase subunit K/omega
MISTLPLEEIVKKTRTVYEAVLVIARRARQINEMRRAKMEMEMEMGDQTEDFFEEALAEVKDKVYETRKKPTRQAIDELLNDELRVFYPESENPDEASK